MYTHTYSHTYVHIDVYIDVYIYIFTHIRISRCTHTYVYLDVYIDVHTYIFTYIRINSTLTTPAWRLHSFSSKNKPVIMPETVVAIYSSTTISVTSSSLRLGTVVLRASARNSQKSALSSIQMVS